MKTEYHIAIKATSESALHGGFGETALPLKPLPLQRADSMPANFNLVVAARAERGLNCRPHRGRLQKQLRRQPPVSKKAFTLVELMMAVALFGMIMGGAIGVFVMCQKLWHATSLSMATNRDGSIALSRLVYGIGSNNGLRTASSISVTDKKGMWTGTGHVYPPAPGDKAHFLVPAAGSPDGSWRLTCINPFDGTNRIDFNKEVSNIVLWVEDPGEGPGSVPQRETRQLICNYVSDAVVSNNGLSGVNIQLTIVRQEGQYTSTTTNKTFVKRRN